MNVWILALAFLTPAGEAKSLEQFVVDTRTECASAALKAREIAQERGDIVYITCRPGTKL